VLPRQLDDPLGHVTLPFRRQPRGIILGGIVTDRRRHPGQLAIFFLSVRHNEASSKSSNPSIGFGLRASGFGLPASGIRIPEA
jgi:hypothetical protein